MKLIIDFDLFYFSLDQDNAQRSTSDTEIEEEFNFPLPKENQPIMVNVGFDSFIFKL